MKKEVWKSSIEEISIEEAVKDFCKEYCGSIDSEDFDSEFKQEVKDQNGVIIGYRFDETDYYYLKNEIKEQVRELI